MLSQVFETAVASVGLILNAVGLGFVAYQVSLSRRQAMRALEVTRARKCAFAAAGNSRLRESYD